MKLIIFLSLLFIISILISCESTLTDDAGDFCIEVNNLNFTKVEYNIEKYLDYVSVYHIETDVYYEMEILKLKNWMETKSCVMEVTLGSGVIETEPPVKHLTIIFVTTDSTFTKSFDIILEPNLDVRFH